MAQYAPGLFSTLQHTHSAHPAPDEDADAVQQPCGVARKRPLRLSRTKNFPLIFCFTC